MGRLFDVGSDKRAARETSARRDEVRRRAEEADSLLREHKELDEASDKLSKKLAEAQSVSPLIYQEYRVPGSKWVIEHSHDGPDYIYQVFALKTPRASWQSIITAMIAAMDSIFPRSVIIKYWPPKEMFKEQFYTIRVTGVTSLPGWELACKEKALRLLSDVDAWTTG